MRELCDAFKTCRVNRLIFTKLDETVDFGNLLNLLNQSDIPLAYLIRDQRIPGGVEAARSAAIADLIFKPMAAGTVRETENQKKILKDTPAANALLLKDDCYVANKNSDIFHRRDCKSVKRIATNNVLVFRSISDAAEKNFKPCRMCCPEVLTQNSFFKHFVPQTAASR